MSVTVLLIYIDFTSITLLLSFDLFLYSVSCECDECGMNQSIGLHGLLHYTMEFQANEVSLDVGPDPYPATQSIISLIIQDNTLDLIGIHFHNHQKYFPLGLILQYKISPFLLFDMYIY